MALSGIEWFMVTILLLSALPFLGWIVHEVIQSCCLRRRMEEEEEDDELDDAPFVAQRLNWILTGIILWYLTTATVPSSAAPVLLLFAHCFWFMTAIRLFLLDPRRCRHRLRNCHRRQDEEAAAAAPAPAVQLNIENH